MRDFYSYPYAILVDVDEDLDGALAGAGLFGRSGWQYQHWSGSLFQFRFMDANEGRDFALLNNGQLHY